MGLIIFIAIVCILVWLWRRRYNVYLLSYSGKQYKGISKVNAFGIRTARYGWPLPTDTIQLMPDGTAQNESGFIRIKEWKFIKKQTS